MITQFVIIGVFIFLNSCNLDDNSTFKDFEISIIGTDFAKVRILTYPDSVCIKAETFDSQYVRSLHFSTLDHGKYIISAYCPYQNLKQNEVSILVDYSGSSGSFTLYFERQ